MGVISNKRFKKLYGKDIFIYPFSEENLKGASYNLTASKVAYYEEQDEKGNKKIVSALIDDTKILCKPNEILYIQTEESIYVSNKISGTYHSKVGWISKGLSPISTTLDPCYFGTSLIMVMNLTDKNIKINVGDTFCTLILNELSKSADEIHDNVAFRKDISSGRIYDFGNLKKIKRIKNSHELDLLINEFDDKKKEQLKKLEEKDCNLVRNSKKNNGHIGLEINWTYSALSEEEKEELEELRKLEKKYKNILKQQESEIDEIQSEYKEKMVKWFEEPFRRNKRELINKIRSQEREKNKGKYEKISLLISILILVTVLVLAPIGILYYTEILGELYGKIRGLPKIEEIGALIGVVVGVMTLIITIIALVSKKMSEFILEVYYASEALKYRMKNIC